MHLFLDKFLSYVAIQDYVLSFSIESAIAFHLESKLMILTWIYYWYIILNITYEVCCLVNNSLVFRKYTRTLQTVSKQYIVDFNDVFVLKSALVVLIHDVGCVSDVFYNEYKRY